MNQTRGESVNVFHNTRRSRAGYHQRYASGVKDERIKRKLEKILRLPAFDFPALGKERGELNPNHLKEVC